jgi:hypothetical protein
MVFNLDQELRPFCRGFLTWGLNRLIDPLRTLNWGAEKV